MESKASESQAEAYTGSKEDWAASRTAAEQEELRRKMQGDVEAFLAKGGEIQQINPHVRADLPRKPTSNYGSQPI